MISKKVHACGPQSAKIMIVGEAPGRQEEIEGRPFVGGAGRVLRDVLAQVGIREQEVFFTNLSKHRPPGNELQPWFNPKTGMPEQPELFEGLLELKEEINAVNPNVIVALGNYPLWFLTGKTRWSRKYGWTGIGDWRGSIIEGKPVVGGRKVVAAYHPAAILRKYSWLPTLQLDLARVRSQADFPDIRRPQKQLYIDPQGEDREWTRRRLLDHGDTITFDIEQLGSNLLCIGMTTDKDEAHVIRTRTGSDIAFVKEILESGKPLCAQNAMFDVSMLEYWFKFHVMENIKHDTMLASHAAYIEQPKDLGFLCSVYTEQPCYWTNIKWPDVKKKLAAGDTSEVDSVDFLTYNAIDVWVTHDVMEQQKADELLDPNVKATFDFEMKLLAPLWKIARRGMLIDTARMKQIELSCMTTIKEKGALLSTYADRPFTFKNEVYGVFHVGTGSKKPLLFTSPQQVSKWFYEELGLPVTRRTETGKASSDDFALADIDLLLPEEDERKPIVRAVRAVRKAQSLISKFTEIEYDKDGRMRCHYNPGGTVTGRLSSKKFFPTNTGANLQNIPREKDIRKVFVPDKGNVFFYNDLERAESLVVAKLTGDPTMLAHHAPGMDAHRELAALLYGVDPGEVSGDQRYMGKQTRHAGNYMEGWKIFMRNVNKIAAATGVAITGAEAKMFIGMYRELHPYLGRWWDDTAVELRTKRKLYNLCPHHRMRQFFGRRDAALPEAVAYVPQSTVGDAVNIALLRIADDEELREYGVEMLVQVHDAIGGQVPEKHLLPAMKRMKELMKVDLVVPKTGEVFAIPVEIAFGPSWGECKAYTGDFNGQIA